MKMRIQWRRSRYGRKQRLLVWAERLFLLVACLALGYCLVVYSEAGLYQAFETRRFENTLPLSPAPHGGASRVEQIPFSVALQALRSAEWRFPASEFQ